MGPNLSTFLFTHGHRGINMGQHGTNWGARGSVRLKMASTWAKMGAQALKSGQKWSKAATGSQIGLKMVQNGPKCPFPRPKLPKSSAWRVPQHSGVGTLGTGDRSTEGIHSRVPVLGGKCTSGTPLPDVHRVPPPSLMYIGYYGGL